MGFARGDEGDEKEVGRSVHEAGSDLGKVCHKSRRSMHSKLKLRYGGMKKLEPAKDIDP